MAADQIAAYAKLILAIAQTDQGARHSVKAKTPKQLT
jgi:hypothetical protein